MAIANNPCNSHYIATPVKSRNSLWTIGKLLKIVLKPYKTKKFTSLKDMRDLPVHIKKDIGFWDVKPAERPRLPTYH